MAPLPELMEAGVQKQALGQVVVSVCVPGVGWGIQLGWWLEALCRGQSPHSSQNAQPEWVWTGA